MEDIVYKLPFCDAIPSLCDFFSLYLRVIQVIFATFVFTFGLLCIDFFVGAGSSMIRSKEDIPSKKVLGIRLLRCVRTASLITLILLVPLTCGAIRRAFTNAASFDIAQMWLHSLASVVDIALMLLINKFLARNTLQQLGFPSYPANGLGAFVPNFYSFIRRFVVVHFIVVGTHLITPIIYFLGGCLTKWEFVDYSKNAFYLENGILGLTYFMIVQQICFFINGVDEESSWRGFANAVWMKERHSPLTLYLVSGWIYAMVHSLNSPYTEFFGFCIVLLNLIFEGAAWMLLYRTSHDLLQNWMLHDIDDLFSIWFGAESLAGYGLPAGQVAPYQIGCPRLSYASGGDFGTGGSVFYFFQTGYTVVVVLIYSIVLWTFETSLPDWYVPRKGRVTLRMAWERLKETPSKVEAYLRETKLFRRAERESEI